VNIKVFLGSFGAVVLLVLASFINVVGVQSTLSNSVNSSPLFQIRTQTAINEKSLKALQTEYLNKGHNTLIISPSHRNDVLFRRLVDKISRMDDESFHHFISVVLTQMRYENFYRDTTPLEINIAFHQIRGNPDALRNYLNHKEDGYSYTAPSCMQCTIGNWIPGCFFSEVIIVLLGLLSAIIDVIVKVQTVLGIGNCGTYCCTIDHGCSFFPGS
jgi:hypothetical protein